MLEYRAGTVFYPYEGGGAHINAVYKNGAAALANDDAVPIIMVNCLEGIPLYAERIFSALLTPEYLHYIAHSAAETLARGDILHDADFTLGRSGQ